MKRLTDILRNVLDVQEEQIKDNSNFVKDLGADSLTVVEIVMEIEEEFDIEIPDEETQGLETVKDLRDYVKDKIQ
jgi:acyl carrier protein